MRVFRAHDGRSFEVNQPFAQLNTVDDLIDAFSLATGIPSDAIICMSGSGAQLSQESLEAAIRQESIRNAGVVEPHEMVQDPEYFVFNREFLYADLDVLARDLEEPVDLGPDFEESELPYPPTPRSLAQLLEWSSHLLDIIQSHTSSARELQAHLAAIQRSTSVALLNLVSHATTVRSSYEAVGKTAARELDRMQGLLDGHERDLKVLGMVSINPRLLSGANAPVNAASKQQPVRERKLGHYIHQEKMTAVFAACSAVHDEIRDRAHELTAKALELSTDTEGLQQEVQGTSIAPSTEELEKAEQASERAEHLHAFLLATCSPDENGWPVADKLADDAAAFREVEASVRELFLLGHVARDALTQLAADKNDMISRALHLLGDISSLQSDFADLSAALTALDADLRSDRVDGFRHLARLKNVLWAYGATVIEIVRRREFAHRFLGRSQAMAELMAKVSAGERGKRSSFKTDVVALLPWEVKGIDEAPPTLEITTHKLSQEGLAELSRDDVEGLMATLDEVGRNLDGEEGTSAIASRNQIPEVKAALLELMSRLDSFDAEFSRLVEIGLLGKGREDGGESDSGSDDGLSRRDAQTQAASVEQEKLARELQNARREAADARRQAAEAHDQELAKLHAEMSRVRAELRGKEAELEHARHEMETGRRNLDSLRSEAEMEAARRINMKEELARLRQDAEDARRAEAAAKAEAREEGDRAVELEQHLHDMAVELEEAKAARQDAAHRIEALLGEGSSAERELSSASERIEELSRQLEAARAETREVREHLAETEAGRDKVLRTQRDEAESKRAAVEETLRAKEAALQAALEDKERAEQRAEEAETLRGQLRAADETHEELVRQLDQARETAVEAEMAQRHAERMLDTMVDHTRPLVARTAELRRFVRAMPALTSRSKSGDAAAPAQEDAAGEASVQAAVEAFEADVSSAPAEVVLEALKALDVGAQDEAKTRLDSLATLVRKWQKAYKSCSEKLSRATASAKDRIAFRNFSPGDLALFLPTRNQSSVVKPWAAFNISFPHHFLNATGSLADQLRSKEWIVARITSIRERVADSSQEGGNPFQLADGVRFFLLDVEAYNHPPTARTRTGSLTVARSSSAAALPKPGDSAPKSAPELKRNLSEGARVESLATPRSARRQASEGAKRPSIGAIVEEERAGAAGGTEAAPKKRMADAAVSAVMESGPAPTPLAIDVASDVSRSSSPSALTRALRSQPRHPISPDTRHPVGGLSTLGATRQPWPMASTSADDASIRSSPAALAHPSAAPAFSRGRGRRAPGRQRETSAVDEKAPRSIPINAATSRSSAAAEAVSAAAPLNPFSQSPAPGGSPVPQQDYFSPRRRKSSNLVPREAAASTPSRSSTTPLSPARPGGTLPRSISARSRRISINGTSLMLSHTRSSTSGTAAPAITSAAFFEGPASGGSGGGLASVSPSLASAVGETAAASPSRGDGASPRTSPQRSASSSSGFFSAFTLGRRAGSSAAAAAASGPSRATGGSRYPVAAGRIRRGDGDVTGTSAGSARSTASEALRRLADGR